MLGDMLQAMRAKDLRPLFLVLVALLFATGPMPGAFAGAQAANPHAGMVMSDSGSDDGCCDHSTPDESTLCAAHCAAGIIAASVVITSSEAVSTSIATVFVLPDASHAPVPDTAPPKSAAA